MNTCSSIQCKKISSSKLYLWMKHKSFKQYMYVRYTIVHVYMYHTSQFMSFKQKLSEKGELSNWKWVRWKLLSDIFSDYWLVLQLTWFTTIHQGYVQECSSYANSRYMSYVIWPVATTSKAVLKCTTCIPLFLIQFSW